MATATETEVEVNIAQAVHADIYDVPKAKLVELQKNEPKKDEGGSLCSICKRKGCRIGPMMRG